MGILTGFSLQSDASGSEPEIAYLDVPGSVFKLAVEDLDGDGVDELVYATYDGWVRCTDAASASRERWAWHFDSFPTGLLVRTGSPDGTRSDGVFLSDVDGSLTALNLDGTLRWQWHGGQALHGVAFARVSPDLEVLATGGFQGGLVLLDPASGRERSRHPVEHFVQRVAAGDIDGDGFDEVVIADHRENIAIFRWQEDELKLEHRTPLFLGDTHRNWESPTGTFKVYSLAVADLDGDGRAEILAGDSYFNPQAVAAFSSDGALRWYQQSSSGHDHRPGEFYSTAFVHPLREADRMQVDGAVLAVVNANRLRLLDAEGCVRVEATAEIGFTDLVVRHGWLYLGSSPNGDRTVYRLRFDGDIGRRFGSLRRHGLVERIGGALAELRSRILALPPAGREAEPAHGWLVPSGPSKDPGDDVRVLRNWMSERFPNAPVSPFVQLPAMERPMPLRPDGTPWNSSRWELDTWHGTRTRTADELVAQAERMEAAGIPFSLYAGHSCTPFVTLDTARRLIAAAPRHLRGFYTAEDEGKEAIEPFIRDFHAPLGDLLLASGSAGTERFNVTKNKNVWWLAAPAWPGVYEGLFGGGRGGLLMPATEDSNSRTPELNLLARFGLYQSGLVKRFFVSHIEDLNSFNRMHQLEYTLHGHPVLRYLVAHTLLGGREFAVRGGANLRWREGSPEFGPIGEESTAIYLGMLAKGLVYTPRPEEMANLLPLGFRMHPAPDAWLEDGFNGHQPQLWRPRPELKDAVLPHNGANWGMTRTPPDALTSVLLNKRRQFGRHIPATPFGLFVFVPAGLPRDAVPGVRDWWETDGVAVWREDDPKWRLKGTAAAKALLDSFSRASETLPIGVAGDDVFMQVARRGNGGYRIWLIDPGWWDPADRVVRLTVRSGGVEFLRDAVTGECLDLENGEVTLTVPAGALRILDT